MIFVLLPISPLSLLLTYDTFSVHILARLINHIHIPHWRRKYHSR